ncbi:transcriptional regulator, AsnC family [Segatella baroniae F0067]|jgi:regulatory protein asnC|uniref:Transcriptional regulator, AsnC family n=2 Tax=Segatella baroniae TaxID=305719 RepID=U2P4L0_9BACT|nr:transcriptional regulator, AsnC family [Segatella baroniae F0067]
MRGKRKFFAHFVVYIIYNLYFCFVGFIFRINHQSFLYMDKIDSLDKKILSILSKNARIPFKDVAAECGVSRAAIHQRVQHLVEGGIVTGSGFHINPKSLGYSTCTYVGLNLERGSMYKDVVERLDQIPEVVECHFTTGPYTMLVKLYAKDNEQLMNLLNGQLQEIPGVVSTETLISLEQSIKREVPVVIAEK